jgi:hypothetical protein
LLANFNKAKFLIELGCYILYASGHLEGATSDWWDAYTVAHAATDTITWQEFQESFRTHHIPAGVKKLKQK